MTNERQSCVIIVDPLSQYLPIRNVHRFEMIVVYTASFVLISDEIEIEIEIDSLLSRTLQPQAELRLIYNKIYTTKNTWLRRTN